MTAFEIIIHLRKCSRSRHAIDAVNIMSDMQQYFEESASITVHIKMMETAQKKAAQAKLPISDNMLVVIANKAILASNHFPRATDAWEEKTNEEKRGLSGRILTSPPKNPVKIAFALQNIQVANILARPTPPPPPIKTIILPLIHHHMIMN